MSNWKQRFEKEMVTKRSTSYLDYSTGKPVRTVRPGKIVYHRAENVQKFISSLIEEVIESIDGRKVTWIKYNDLPDKVVTEEALKDIINIEIEKIQQSLKEKYLK